MTSNVHFGISSVFVTLFHEIAQEFFRISSGRLGSTECLESLVAICSAWDQSGSVLPWINHLSLISACRIGFSVFRSSICKKVVHSGNHRGFGHLDFLRHFIKLRGSF